MTEYVIPLGQLSMQDVPRVGGKNASLGEMLQNLAPLGVRVPGGFATTADAYREFLAQDGLAGRIAKRLHDLDVSDVPALQAAGGDIRRWIMEVSFPASMETAIEQAYLQLEQEYSADVTWAVRSSATAEDLPDASFAGQQETFLNVSGLEHIKRAIREVFASLFNDRAIAYREHQGFNHEEVALSAGIQKMVRSDIGSAGVAFTLDTESGFEDVVFITGSYGLGEMVVQGAVNPDEFYVHKATLEAGRPAVLRRTLGQKVIKMIYSGDRDEPVKTVDVDAQQRLEFCLDDEEIQALARMAVTIEKHYQRPMDIEWAKDGIEGKIYIVQARPETVQSRQKNVVEKYRLKQKGKLLAEGRSIGSRIGSGTARIFNNLDQMDEGRMSDDVQKVIHEKTTAYGDPVEFYISRLAEGVSTIAAAFHPQPVIVRMSDFKSNEYANLVGGRQFEPREENPMIGYRGASRYISAEFRDCFELECQAMKRVRDEMGFSNIELMIPFVRTLGEAQAVVDILRENGLERGKNDLRLIMMCELPSNAILAAQFLEYFDGFSIGSNDMTQLTLGLDRDSALVAGLFDERDPAVQGMLEMAISACNAAGKYVGICGQGPSDHPDMAKWLLERGISSISLNPDTVVDTWQGLAG